MINVVRSADKSQFQWPVSGNLQFAIFQQTSVSHDSLIFFFSQAFLIIIAVNRFAA